MRIHILAAIVLILTSCSEDATFNFLLGPQPNFIEDHEYSNTLNIFGVLRPDSIDGQPLSFILVEKTIPAVTSIPDSFHVYNARVMLYAMENGVDIDSFEFTLDTARTFASTYRSSSFNPEVGVQYRLECSREGFPSVTAYAVVPDVPEIVNGETTISSNEVNFLIANNPLAAMFDVILIAGNQFISQRVLQVDGEPTAISIRLEDELPAGSFLLLYSYDSNMASYLTEASVFIKPNTYRPPFTNVSGGYGSFGGMNSLFMGLNE